MKEYLISIVIPCYNHGEFLEETLQSIVSATDKYVPEVIIVNDGSTDKLTLEVLKRVEQNGYFVLHQENQGLAKARNNGIALAKGKYILPLDSDNNVCKPYLNEAIDLLEKNKQIDIVYGDAKYFGEKEGVWKNAKLDKKRILIGNQIDACAVFRKTSWIEVGGYAENMPFMGNEDWNFWLRCLNAKQKFFYLDKICFEYRVLSNSMIRSVNKDFEKKIFAFNVEDLFDLYKNSMKKDADTFHNILSGNLLKKTAKLMLNHFGKYKY